MASERGQASVEWAGLLLLVALVLAALVALAPRVEGRGLGAAVAGRISCAARGECVPRALPAPPAAVVPEAIAPLRRSRGQARAVPPFVHRVAGAVARRAWIACLGYRRYRYERAHPERLSPYDPMPLGDGLEIANACLNPAGFLGVR